MTTSNFVHYDQSGKIVGIYNLLKHKDIPKPHILISTKEKDAIVARPTDFSVDVTKRKLLDTEASKEAVEGVSDAMDQHQIQHNALIARGVKVGNTYFFADDEASAHATQCLILSQHAKNPSEFKAQLKCNEEGNIQYKTINQKVLIQVVEEINKVRTQAKILKLENDATTISLI